MSVARALSNRMNNPLAPHPMAWYLAVLRRQWPIVVGFTAALFVVVLVMSLLSTRYYASSATIEIREDAPMVLSNMKEVMPTAPMWQLDKFFRTQHWILESPMVMNEAIRELRELTEAELSSERCAWGDRFAA